MLQKKFNNMIDKYFFFLIFFFNIKLNYTLFNFYCVITYFKLNFKTKYLVEKKKKKNYIYKKRFYIFSFDLMLKNAIVTSFFFKNKKKSKLNKKLNKNPGYKYFLKKYLKKRHKIKNFLYSKVFTHPQRFLVKKSYKSFTLRQRHFIVKNILMRRLFSFLVKNNKITTSFLKSRFLKKKKVFLANMHKKLAWKMHKGRIIHWNFSTKGQLNKYRYNKLLANVLFFLKKNSLVTFLIFLLFSFYSFVSSYRQIFLLFSKNLVVYNGRFVYTNVTVAVGDIIELPFGSGFLPAVKTNLSHFYNKRLKKLTYKFLKTRKKKKIPKIYKKLLFSNKLKRDCLAYDPTLNIIAIIYKIPAYNSNLNKELLKSSVIGLQNWRYEFQ